MKRVFISYSRNDKEFAKRLAKSLREVGADVWIDMEDIEAGTKWSTAVQEGLDTSDALIVIISPESMTSTNVEDEWQYFLDTGKPVIPILLKAAKIHFQLHRLQYIDFSIVRFGDAFSRLLDELENKGVPITVETAEDTWVYEVRKTNPPRRNLSEGETTASSPETEKRKNEDFTTKSNPRAIIAGIGALLVLGIVAVLPFFINFDGGNLAELKDFSPEPPPVVFYFEGLEVENEEGDTMYFDSIIVKQRYWRDGEEWIQVYDIDTATNGYLARDHLYLDDYQVFLLNFVPYAHRLSNTRISLFTAYREGASNHRLDVDDEIQVYGFRYDESGQLWYQIRVELEETGEVLVGWYSDSAQEFGLVGRGQIPALAYTLGSTRAYWDEERNDYVRNIPANTLVPVLSEDDDEGAWWVGVYHNDEWHIYWIDDNTLDINDITAQFVY